MPTFWGADAGDDSYRRNDDIPIMGDHFRRRPRTKSDVDASRCRKRSRGPSSNLSGRRRRDRDATIDSDTLFDESDDDIKPPYFLDQIDDDQEEWRHQYEYNKRRRKLHRRKNNTLDSFRSWAMDKTGVHIPRINLHFDPITILKIRKSWHNIIPGAIIRVGADFETHRLGRGLWRLRGCVEDKFIGGRFTIKERRRSMDTKNEEDRAVLMEYSKSWLFAGTGKLLGCVKNFKALYDNVRYCVDISDVPLTLGLDLDYLRIYGYPIQSICSI